MTLWTPSEISTALYLDAFDASTITIDTGVTEWRDKSGNNRSPANTIDASQPARISGGLNGKDIVRFDGSNDYLVFPGSAATDYALKFGAGSFSIIALIRPNSVSANPNIFFGARGYDAGWFAGFSADDPSIRLYNAAELWNPFPMSAVTATTDWQIFAATAPRGGTGKYYRNGVLVQSTTAIVGSASLANERQVRIGSYTDNSDNTAGPFNGDIAKIIIVAGDMSDDIRQKIEGCWLWEAGLESLLPAGHPYEDAAPTIDSVIFLNAVLDQPYGDPVDIYTSLSQVYSLLLETWLTQPYRDVPLIGATLNQPYSSPTELSPSLEQKWNYSAAELAVSLDQPWLIPGPLEAICEQRYGIAAEVLHKTCEQIYDINQHSTLFADLVQPYALASEQAMLYSFDVKLFVDDVRVKYYALEWQADENSFAWSCDFSVKDIAVALRCVAGAIIRIETPWDTWLLKCYNGWCEDRRHGSRLFRVTAYSRTRDLDIAQPLTSDLPDGMASQIIADLAAPFGISVTWQMADGYLLGAEIGGIDKTPLAAIRDIVNDAKGIVQSTSDGNLLIVAQQETAIPDYPTITPADTIITRLERITTSESIDDQRGYNFFKVSDQIASNNNFRQDEVRIDATTKEFRLFVVPLAPEKSYTLGHSGGTNVSIEPFGIRSLTIVDEQVEFVSGVGQTDKPVYSITAKRWQKADLGDVVADESGLLTATTAGESLLKISYVTKYRRWLARDRDIEDVQFIFREAD